MFASLLTLCLSLAGCSKPLPMVSNREQHDRVYREAHDLIKPYMRLQGVKAQRVDAAGKEKIARGIALLGEVTRYAPSNWSAY